MWALLLALTLSGNVTYDSRPGRLGFEGRNGTVIHVLRNSNALKAGLKKGDKVISGYRDCLGNVGEEVTLIVKRGDQILTFVIVRQPVAETDSHYDD